MRLQYEIATTGQQQLRTVFRGIEREASASNRRMSNDARRTAQRTSREAAGPMFGPGRREQIAALRANERAAIASARNEARERLSQERSLHRAKESLDKQRSRSLMAHYSAEQREQRRVITERASLSKRIGRGMATSVGGGVKRVAGMAGTVATILGGIGIAGALAEETSIRRKASELANQAGAPGSKGQLASESLGVRGFSGSETLDAMSSFVTKTGDLNAARGLIQGLGQLSLATSADFGEMGEAAGQAFNVIRDTIKDPKEQLAAVNDVMTTLAAQGNMGAVEIRDMATELATLGAATRSFKGGPVELLKTMGAMSQATVARGGAPSAAEASTAISRFAADLTKKPAQKALGAMGVDVFSDKSKTQLKDPSEIMADIMAKTGGDLTKIEEVLNAESKKALQGFSPLYLEAERKKKGAGKQAMLDEFARFKGATLSKEDVNARANSRLEDPDLVFKENMKAFNAAVGSQLLPALTALVPSITQLAPQLGTMARGAADFISWFSQNPIKGVGSVVLASVAKDMAASGIQSALSSGVSSLVGSMTAAQLGVAKLAGASAFAAAAWYAVYAANEGLKKETGGKGILDVGWEWATTDKNLKEIADENLDKQARADAADRMRQESSGAVSLNGTTGAASTGTPPAAAGSAPVVPPGGAGLDKSAAALERAAGALEKAAGSMPKGGGRGGGPDPSRTSPIISPSRG